MMTKMTPAAIFIAVFVAVAGLPTLLAQNAQPAGGGANESWWVNKAKGGVYNPPMRPLWKLSDLKQMHAGQNNWQEQIIRDPEQDATYNSAAPGTRFTARLHPDTPTVFVVIAGDVRFTIEGQQPVAASRGSIVNIMKTTIFSYDVAGTQNALWVEVNPANYKTAYPVSGPQPAAASGAQVVKVSFNHTPGAYAPPNQPHWNLFDDGFGKCAPVGPKVVDDHLFASPLIGYVNPADNKCPGGRGNVGGGPDQGAFNPNSTFGHMHAGPAEWWIVQVGAISGRFEGVGEYHATEGDVLYAAPMTWHQMGAEARSGPSVRLAMGGYPLINMNSTAAP
jgi:quercetin dioxygenase-like cupin family protein